MGRYMQEWIRRNGTLARMLMRAIEQGHGQAAEHFEVELARDTPGQDRKAIHPYARGVSQGSWGRTRNSPTSVHIDNTARKKGRAYYQHVNVGATRQGGPRTAKSFHIRNVQTSYTDLTWARVSVRLRGDYERPLALVRGY